MLLFLFPTFSSHSIGLWTEISKCLSSKKKLKTFCVLAKKVIFPVEKLNFSWSYSNLFLMWENKSKIVHNWFNISVNFVSLFWLLFGLFSSIILSITWNWTSLMENEIQLDVFCDDELVESHLLLNFVVTGCAMVNTRWYFG